MDSSSVKHSNVSPLVLQEVHLALTEVGIVAKYSNYVGLHKWSWLTAYPIKS